MTFAERYGPWALIAGASEGTGASFARQLAAQGINLVLIARRREPLETLTNEIRSEYGVDCVFATIDLAADDAAARLAAVADEKEVGLLILNAGADSNGSMFLDNDVAAWEALVMRNVMCVMQACHHFAAPMRERGRGGVIIVGSGAGYGGLPGVALYCATKAFDLVLGEALWAELREHGVDVLSYMIGRTDTPAHRELMTARGMAIPHDMANADDVARIGLERLPHGPIHNWGQDDDDAGTSGASAASRRERVLAIAQLSARYAGKTWPDTGSESKNAID